MTWYEKAWLAVGAFFVALGLSWIVAAGAVVGAVVLIVMNSADAMRVRLGNAFCGVLLAFITTPAIGAYLEVKPLVNGFIALAIVLWGMVALHEVNNWVKAGGFKGLLAGLLDRLPKGGA